MKEEIESMKGSTMFGAGLNDTEQEILCRSSAMEQGSLGSTMFGAGLNDTEQEILL